ncbi:hypothetical protein ACQ4M3_24565 [Leptolyngbya sp. AN03gr2]|uniref:hypothetical protein n=1 Tax=unclassified Leptolyngbya TaxID=2650499 RepID=UPI003D319FB4
MVLTRGTLDPITLKITELPVPVEVENGWQEFAIDVGASLPLAHAKRVRDCHGASPDLEEFRRSDRTVSQLDSSHNGTDGRIDGCRICPGTTWNSGV